MNTIRIDQLKITHAGDVLVDIAFEIRRSLALVGASGSGKSLTLKALLGLSDPALDVLIEKQCDFEWQRGQSIFLVYKTPLSAITPLTRIKDPMFLPKEQSVVLFSLLGLDESL